MNEQEKRDAQDRKQEEISIMKSAFFGMSDALRLSAEELKHTGHKTNDAAALSIYKFAQQRIDKLWKDHIKQYPDER